MNALEGAGAVKSPAVTSCVVTSSPTDGVEPSGSVPLELIRLDSNEGWRLLLSSVSPVVAR